MGKGMARAAMGGLEPQCWTIVMITMGCVTALLTFLFIGITADGDEDLGLATIVAPDCGVSACAVWDPADQDCVDLKADLWATPADSVAKTDDLMKTPCEIDTSCIAAKLGQYWLARCGALYTGTLVGNAAKAKAEATCAHLGMAKSSNALLVTNADFESAATCTALTIDTVDEAARCAAHPTLAYETIQYLSGGANVDHKRCSAVAFANLIQGTQAKYCSVATALNSVAVADVEDGDVIDDTLCVYENRVCTVAQLNGIIGAISQHADFNETAEADSVTDGTMTAGCADGYVAKVGTGVFTCSLRPLLDAEGVPMASTAGNATTVYGSWTGSLTCVPAPCAPYTNPSNFCADGAPGCDAGAWSCGSKVYGEACPAIECERGYTASGSLSCEASGVIAGDGACTANACMATPVSVLDGTPVAGGILTTDGAYAVSNTLSSATAATTGQNVPIACAVGFQQVGVHTCTASVGARLGTNLGGGCSDAATPCGYGPSAAISVSDMVAESSSGTGHAAETVHAISAFDNDLTTYWQSSRFASAVVSAANPDYLFIYVPNGVRPCSYSIQLGKSAVIAEWTAALAYPTAWSITAGESSSGTGATHDAATPTEIAAVSGHPTTSWMPHCDYTTLDHPAQCGPTPFALTAAATATSIEYTSFKIAFTAEDDGGVTAKKLIIQSISFMEAYADLVPAEMTGCTTTKFVATGGATDDAASTTLKACAGATTNHAATTLVACQVACAASDTCAAFEFVGTACTFEVTTVACGAAASSSVDVAAGGGVCYKKV